MQILGWSLQHRGGTPNVCAGFQARARESVAPWLPLHRPAGLQRCHAGKPKVGRRMQADWDDLQKALQPQQVCLVSDTRLA